MYVDSILKMLFIRSFGMAALNCSKTSTSLDSALIKSKFRGALLGSLMGDCFGATYEGKDVSAGDKLVIQKYFDKLEDPTHTGPYKKYTDDTAMTKSVGKFLIDKPEPDYKFLAKLFVEEFYKQPNRGYGSNIVDVFEKLKNSKYENVFKPAEEQFHGGGSYGNGGAMRIAPVALYYHNDYERMLEVATNVTKVTHTNILGVNGALLECLAIQQALHCDPNEKIDPKQFCDQLYDKIKAIESNADADLDIELRTAYGERLKLVEHILKKEWNDEIDEEVVYCIGNGVGAYESVPTAIYCFLRALNDIPVVKTDNIFRRTIQYAITLGGDTDTIASMAGAIAGAYLGEENINKQLISHCELNKEVIEMADNLYNTQHSVQSSEASGD